MTRYKKFEHLPWWLNNLNDNTLTPTQKEVHDLDYYCKKHGNKLSHQQAADRLDRSRRSIIYARNRLEELGLRSSETVKGSIKVGHPIEYQNEAEFLAQLKARGVSLTSAKFAPKSVQKKIPFQGISSSQVKNVAGSKQPAGEFFSQAPRGLTDRCSGGGESDSSADRKRKDELLWEVEYDRALHRISSQGHDRRRAENLARISADHYIAKRKAEREKILVQKNSAAKAEP